MEGQPCKYGDPACPCQDGDMCHYEGPGPMTPPIAAQRSRKDTINGVRLAIRGYGNGVKVFDEIIETREIELDKLAEKHTKRLLVFDRHMIELEFLDEADVSERFFRFGTDPTMMVKPLAVDPSTIQ